MAMTMAMAMASLSLKGGNRSVPPGTTPRWGQKSQGAAVPNDLPRFRAKNRKRRGSIPKDGAPQGRIGWADPEPVLQVLLLLPAMGACGVEPRANLRPVGRQVRGVPTPQASQQDLFHSRQGNPSRRACLEDSPCPLMP